MSHPAMVRYGGDASISIRDNEFMPVVHVSPEEVLPVLQSFGMRLPTEREAVRIGLDVVRGGASSMWMDMTRIPVDRGAENAVGVVGLGDDVAEIVHRPDNVDSPFGAYYLRGEANGSPRPALSPGFVMSFRVSVGQDGRIVLADDGRESGGDGYGAWVINKDYYQRTGNDSSISSADALAQLLVAVVDSDPAVVWSVQLAIARGVTWVDAHEFIDAVRYAGIASLRVKWEEVLDAGISGSASSGSLGVRPVMDIQSAQEGE